MSDINETLGVVKEIIKVMAEDKEFATLQARCAKNLYDAFINEGLNQHEALTLTAASIKNYSNQ